MMTKTNYLLIFLCFSFSLNGQFADEQLIGTTLGQGLEVFAGDLNNDNTPDILVGGDDFLYWHPNSGGTGFFEKAIIIDEGDIGFKSVHADDLDNDGDLDVLAVSSVEAWIGYYENLGNGEFGDRVILYQDADYATVVFTADVDNDGDIDVLGSSRETSPGPAERLRLFKNNGSLSFSNGIPIGYLGSSGLRTTIEVADLNGDDFVEIISTNANSNNIRVYVNDGDGTFTYSSLNPTDSNMRMHGSIVADLDNDEAIDIFYTDYYTAQVYFKNNGDGSFTETNLGTNISGIDGDTIDYDNDGDLDILTVSFGSGTSQWGGYRIHTNEGNGVYTSEDFVGQEGIVSSRAAVADFNMDGFPDFTIVTGGDVDNQQVVWFENNNGDGFLPVKTVSESGRNIFDLGLYDFNNDQIEDLYMVSIEDQKITWLEGVGDKEFGRVHTVGFLNGGLGRTIFEDFDNDGDKDFISTDQTTAAGTDTDGHLYFFENDGMGNFSEETLFPAIETAEDIENVQFADFDMDGDLDLAMYQSSSPEGKVSFLENLGGGSYGSLTEIGSFPNLLRTLLVLDFDNDGLEDILTGDLSLNAEGSIYWSKNLGGNSFTSFQTILNTNNTNLFEFKLSDIDFDNDLDLLVTFEPQFGGAGELHLYKNNGNNTFASEVLITTFATSGLYGFGQFEIGDIDVDGDLDILSGNSGLKYSIQEADGSFTTTDLISFDSVVTEVLLDDPDNDGDLDVFIGIVDPLGGSAFWQGIEKISLLENYSNNASLNGFVFHDENGNGIFDNNEEKIANQTVGISPGAIATYTADEGDFNFYVNEGTYTIIPDLDECWDLTSMPAEYEVNTNGIDFQDGFNFGASLVGGDENVEIQMISAPTRCGFTVPFWLTATNKGCTIADGYVQLVLSDLATLLSVDPVQDEMIGDTLRWNYSNLFPGEKVVVELSFEIADASNLGAFIEMPLGTFYDNAGSIEAGREFLFESQINCAYDPNDKQVYPSRTEIGYEENYLIPDEPLLYTIRFQNTGTDTAFNIVIRDQLSTSLDWTTFQPETASHDFESTLHDDGLVEFHFRDILLVDSFTNEPASHGFVNFSINPMAGLPENTQIENTAGIYFDFNSPIITNTVENIFVEELPSLLPPVAAFSSVVDGGEVTFTNLSMNTPNTSQWTFGDGESSSDFSPTHTYTTGGTYEVCLTVTNNYGEDTTCETLTIILPPFADFSYLTEELEVVFENLSANNPTSSSWTFGDGSSSTETSPSYNYTSPGIYEVCLSVSNAAGMDSTCQMVEVITISVSNNTKNNSFILMPNPASEKVSLFFEKSIPSDAAFEVFSVIGQKVSAPYRIENNRVVFEINHLPQGVYYLKGDADEDWRLVDSFIIQE